MKSSICKIYGGPEVLQVGEIEKPTPKPNEVLIRVRATTVNRTDTALLTGYPLAMRLFVGFFKPKNPILGTDFAGEIEGVGEKVKNFKIGDRVMGFNDEGLGSQAEYMTFSADGAMIKIPDNFDFAQAAASMEGTHYARNFLRKVKIEKGQNVLVNGATGAIGSAAVQMLKAMNKVHITAVGNTKNIEMIKSLGADVVYDYQKEDFTKKEGKYHFIFDAVGKSEFGKCKPLLHPGGVYISSELGPSAENLWLPAWTSIVGGKQVIFPFPLNIKQSLDYIKGLIEKGQFKPVIDRRYPLDQIAEAYAYTLTEEKTGNVILEI